MARWQCLLPLWPVWLASAVLASRLCDRLTVRDSHTGDKVQQLCETEFNDTECSRFVGSFNKSHLPFVLTPDALSIERPSNVDVVGLILNESMEGEQFKIPGARVQWSSPISERAQESLKGFLLIWQTENVSKCRIFKFHESSQPVIKMLTFSYDIEKLNGVTDYVFTVFSLPPPASQFRDDSRRFVRMRMSTFLEYKAATDPAKWTPSILTKTWPNGTIDVKFTLSPPEFNLTNFEILLMKLSVGKNTFYKAINYTGELFSLAKPEGFVQFNHLSTDQYQVKVLVVDPFRKVLGSCLCWVYDPEQLGCDNENKCCANTCGTVHTQWFFLNVAEPPQPPVQKTNLAVPSVKLSNVTMEPLSTESYLEDKDAANLSSSKVVIICFALALTLTLTAFLVYLCRKHDLDTRFLKILLCRRKSSSPEKPTILAKTSNRYDSPTTLTTKKIYIMSSDDHSYHIQMVECLARFLELHCHCHVVYPRTADDIHNFHSPYAWFISHISSSNHIIFINSKGAEKLIEASVEKKVYSERESKLEEILFTECLNYLFKDERARDKLLIICFGPAVKKSDYFPSCFNYAIPKNLPNLISKLHALKTKDEHIFSHKLPMLSQSIPNLPRGAELIKAIESSLQYEQENPNWLVDNFGELTKISISGQSNSQLTMFQDKHCSKLEKMISVMSKDSAVSGMGPGSVSLSDFSNCDSPEPAEDDPFQAGHSKETLSIFTVPIFNCTYDPPNKGCHLPVACDTVDLSLRCSAQQQTFSDFIIAPDKVSVCVGSVNAQLLHINELTLKTSEASKQTCGSNGVFLVQPPDFMPEFMADTISEYFVDINNSNIHDSNI